MARKSDGPKLMERLNALMRCHDLQEILNLGRAMVGNPLILTNTSYRVLAITDEPEVTDPRWWDIADNRAIPMGVAANREINEAYRRSLEECRPVFHVPSDEAAKGGVPMLRMALASGSHILGYLESPNYLGDHTPENIEAFEFLANLLTVELQRGLIQARPKSDILDYFVHDLLEGKLTDPKLIAERFSYFKWDINIKGKVQVVSVHGQNGPLEPDNIDFPRLVADIGSTFPLYRTFVYGSEIKVLCSVTESLARDERFLDNLEQVLRREGLVAGISRPLVGIDHISDFNRQAVKAAQLGGMLSDGETRVFFYDDYAIYYALELAGEDENLLQFCHSAVTRLRDYDREHDTELLESLRVYLTHNRSVGESAAALYIHRNTMNYRVAKIHELTELDMTDPDVFCHLLFSFYALKYRRLKGLDEEKK